MKSSFILLLFFAFALYGSRAQVGGTAGGSGQQDTLAVVAKGPDIKGVSVPELAERLLVAGVGIVTFGGLAILLNAIRIRKDGALIRTDEKTK